eukprot:30835-Pelagococcus_subviridis.AAC.20
MAAAAATASASALATESSSSVVPSTMDFNAPPTTLVIIPSAGPVSSSPAFAAFDVSQPSLRAILGAVELPLVRRRRRRVRTVPRGGRVVARPRPRLSRELSVKVTPQVPERLRVLLVRGARQRPALTFALAQRAQRGGARRAQRALGGAFVRVRRGGGLLQSDVGVELKGRGLGGEKRRQKSLRIGVHHADAVVWGPVYRTHRGGGGGGSPLLPEASRLLGFLRGRGRGFLLGYEPSEAASDGAGRGGGHHRGGDRASLRLVHRPRPASAAADDAALEQPPSEKTFRGARGGGDEPLRDLRALRRFDVDARSASADPDPPGGANSDGSIASRAFAATFAASVGASYTYTMTRRKATRCIVATRCAAYFLVPAPPPRSPPAGMSPCASSAGPATSTSPLMDGVRECPRDSVPVLVTSARTSVSRIFHVPSNIRHVSPSSPELAPSTFCDFSSAAAGDASATAASTSGSNACKLSPHGLAASPGRSTNVHDSAFPPPPAPPAPPPVARSPSPAAPGSCSNNASIKSPRINRDSASPSNPPRSADAATAATAHRERALLAARRRRRVARPLGVPTHHWQEPALPPVPPHERVRVRGGALDEPQQELEHAAAHLGVSAAFEELKEESRGGGVDDAGDARGGAAVLLVADAADEDEENDDDDVPPKKRFTPPPAAFAIFAPLESIPPEAFLGAGVSNAGTGCPPSMSSNNAARISCVSGYISSDCVTADHKPSGASRVPSVTPPPVFAERNPPPLSKPSVRGNNAARSRIASARVSACGLDSGARTTAVPPHSLAIAFASDRCAGTPG